jgi:titin
VITGLANLVTYRVKLRAINGIGTGAVSSVVTVKPAATPDAPSALVATPGDGSALITVTAGSDNGAVITNYEYSTDNGSTWTTRSPASAVSPITITGLTNGVTYQIKLRAINIIGTGADSSAVSVKPAAPAPDPAPTP